MPRISASYMQTQKTHHLRWTWLRNGCMNGIHTEALKDHRYEKLVEPAWPNYCESVSSLQHSRTNGIYVILIFHSWPYPHHTMNRSTSSIRPMWSEEEEGKKINWLYRSIYQLYYFYCMALISAMIHTCLINKIIKMFPIGADATITARIHDNSRSFRIECYVTTRAFNSLACGKLSNSHVPKHMFEWLFLLFDKRERHCSSVNRNSFHIFRVNIVWMTSECIVYWLFVCRQRNVCLYPKRLLP